MKLLENKIAIVTGAARGIGEAIVDKFAEQGASIAFSYVSDRSAERAAEIVQRWTEKGVRIKAYQSNAGDFTACETFVADVIKEFGAIDICINNAGISKDNLLLRMTPEQWESVLQVNLNSVFYMTKQVIKPMMKAKSGCIINMSSVIGIMGNAGQASYAASKAGIIGFTKSVAKELGSRSIRCNAIAPGFVETDMTSYLHEGDSAAKYLQDIPLGKFAKGEDIANTALFLASDMGAYITGQTISVCGGLNI